MSKVYIVIKETYETCFDDTAYVETEIIKCFMNEDVANGFCEGMYKTLVGWENYGFQVIEKELVTDD